MDIRFEDSTITAVSPEPIAAHPGDEIIEGAGRIAIPGFVNAHTHLAMVLLRGLADDVPLKTWLEDHVWPIEEQLEPEDIYWCTQLALAEGIRGGTIAFADMYFHGDDIARAAEESGVRLLLSPGMVAPSLDEGGASKLDSIAEIAARWHGAADGRILGALSPHTLYTCGDDVWRATVERAAKLGLPIHSHVSETRREVEEWRAKTGVSPVAHLERIGAFEVPFLAAHCVHVDDEDIAILADRGVSVAHCPKSNAKLGSGIAPVGAMHKAGVTVAIGTDGAASNNRLDMVEEMRTAWMLQRASQEDPMALSAQQAVNMAMSNGRRALGLAPNTLTEGDPADMVLIDRDGLHATPRHDPLATLVFASDALDVTDVLVDGAWLMRDRQLRTIDVERVESEVDSLLRRLGN